MLRAGPAPSSRRSAIAVGMAAATAMAIGLAIQVWSGLDGRTYGDIAPLFDGRGIRPDALPYIDRPLEYPVVIGYVMWACSWVADTGMAFLYANGALLAALGVASTVLLVRSHGRRALLFAGAPTLALYSFHNWDLLPVTACIAGLWLLDRDRPLAAGVVLAIGGWAKLYPGLILVGLIVLALTRAERRTAVRLFVGAAVVTLVANVPVLVASWDGWWHPVRFQGEREATWGSLWYHLIRLPGIEHLDLGGSSTANEVSMVALASSLGLIVWVAARRRVSPAGMAAGVTVAFLLTNKVFSPQYTLWLLPFFVLVPLSTYLWAALVALDLAMYAVVFGDFYPDGKLELSLRADLIGLIVAARAVVLVLVLRASLRAPRLDEGARDRPAAIARLLRFAPYRTPSSASARRA